MKRLYILLGLLALVALAAIFRPYLRTALAPVTGRFTHTRTVAQRLAQFGPAARTRWQPYFAPAKIPYPPSRVILLAIKAERRLEVYAADAAGPPHWLRSCRILAASGGPGPKLAEGDGQVPEGIYPIESLNPNSLFHVSLRVGYPNAFDCAQAARDGRTDLGGDIMIHGESVSVGCLAMGNEVAEDLFVLAADTGLSRVTLLSTPVDFRRGKTVPAKVKLPEWTDALYADLKLHLNELPLADLP